MTYTNTQFDLLNGDFDHLPLCLECELALQPNKAMGRFRRLGVYDRTVARSATQVPAFQQVLQQCPAQPWSMDVNDHWDHLRDHLQQRAQQLCPKKKRQQRQLYFSEAAWTTLCAGKDLRQQFRAMQRNKALLIVRALFATWRAEVGQAQPFPEARFQLHMPNGRWL